jgi:hypothetical protein
MHELAHLIRGILNQYASHSVDRSHSDNSYGPPFIPSASAFCTSAFLATRIHKIPPSLALFKQKAGDTIRDAHAALPALRPVQRTVGAARGRRAHTVVRHAPEYDIPTTFLRTTSRT